MNDLSVVIDYTNHRGERSERWILPREIWFGKSPHHVGQQWFLRADDLEKFAERDFALMSIHSTRRTVRSAEAIKETA